ncbi:hypothetical protein B566_EDAN002697 [Ephemera danica]|nr:hypothetical protein B566_EDAN002697 [Ephemera danica]
MSILLQCILFVRYIVAAMTRIIFVLLGIAVAVHAQVGELVDIGGTTYYVANDVAGVDWNAANWLCGNRSMVVVGLETPQEQNDINNWMRTNGHTGKWWTNGAFVLGSQDIWEWGTSGVQFQENDNRWANDPIQEPDGDPVRWANERVSLSIVNNALNSDQITASNHVICQ